MKKTKELKNILLFKWGKVFHPKASGGSYSVDEDFFTKMKASFDALTEGDQYKYCGIKSSRE